MSANWLSWAQIVPGLMNVAEDIYARESNVCPTPDRVFRAFELVGPEQVRVVILGQDPYHTVGKASGLSFGYHPDYKGSINSSMLNIIAELEACGYLVGDLSLEGWAKQGVLLLNTRLTVEADKPMSHAGLGWEKELTKVLSYLADKKIVWLLWGAEARKAVEKHGVQGPIISTSHPCKYSNKATDKPFTGSECFLKVNGELPYLGHELINWSTVKEGEYVDY